MIYIFYFVLPHTLKVNELPTHSHNMPGYSYGEENSAYRILVMERSNFSLFYDGTYELISASQADGIKRYREWNLGKNGVGKPTTITGNNESH